MSLHRTELLGLPATCRCVSLRNLETKELVQPKSCESSGQLFSVDVLPHQTIVLLVGCVSVNQLEDDGAVPAVYDAGAVLRIKTDEVGMSASPTVLFPRGSTVANITFKGFRIPAIVRLKNGLLYASAEARYGQLGAQKFPSSLVSRLSLDATGTQWGPLRMVQASPNVNFGNALPIADLVTGELFLFYCYDNLFLFVQSTKDGGASWTKRRNVTTALKPASGHAPKGTRVPSWIGAGPSAGVQLPSSGRLLGAVNSKVDGVDSEWLLISDDHGASWRRSAFVPGGTSTGLGEASIALMGGSASQELAMLIRASNRDHSSRPVHHFASTSTNGGDSWAAATPAMTNSPSCADSIIAVHNGSVLLGVAPFGTVRQNLTLWQAKQGEGVAVWEVERTLYPHCAAYSSMAHASGAGGEEAGVVILFEGVFDAPGFDCAKAGSGSYSVALMNFVVAAAAPGGARGQASTAS